MRMRIFLGSLMIVRGVGKRGRWRLVNGVQGDFDEYGGSFAGCAVDGEPATQTFGPLRHAEQAEVAVLWADGVLRREADAVVFNLEHYPGRLERQRHLNQGGTRMFYDIRDRFLSDAKQVFLDDFRQSAGLAFGFKFDANGGAVGNMTGAAEESAGKIELFEG